jgi:Zn-finger nucleic acid-binding protein
MNSPTTAYRDSVGARDLNCPRCEAHLFQVQAEELAGDGCARCGGIWLKGVKSVDALAPRVPAAKALGQLVSERCAGDPTIRLQDRIACPECGARLTRMLAGDVDVDVCAAHGIWFDRNELPRAVATAGAREQVLAPTVAGVEPVRERSPAEDPAEATYPWLPRYSVLAKIFAWLAFGLGCVALVFELKQDHPSVVSVLTIVLWTLVAVITFFALSNAASLLVELANRARGRAK